MAWGESRAFEARTSSPLQPIRATGERALSTILHGEVRMERALCEPVVATGPRAGAS